MTHEKHNHILELIYKISIEQDKDKLNEKFKEILSYVYDNWESPSFAMKTDEDQLYNYTFSPEEQVYKDEADKIAFMDKDELWNNIRTSPESFSEVCYPVAVLKHLLAGLRLPVSHRHVGFDQYHLRYGRLILN
jgi:hypothetical protein